VAKREATEKKRDDKGRFRKGQSGNAGGRPKGSVSLTTLLRHALLEADPTTKKTLARQLIDSLVAEALGGNVRALEVVLERIDGPARAAVGNQDHDAQPRIVIPGSEGRRATERGDRDSDPAP